MKKYVGIILILGAIFALMTINAFASTGAQKGRPPTETVIPDEGILYGDLYVLLRDVDGNPILDVNGCPMPIANQDITATTITIATNGDDLVISASPGEPFQLATYTDPDENEIACELVGDMALWVQAVDFGRLNLGRAPDAVIDHALDEAINKFNLADAMDLDPAGRIMLLIAGEWFTIDAPAENLALYIKMMTDGHWIIPDETPTSKKGGDPAADTVYRPTLSPKAIGIITAFNSDYDNLVDDTKTIADLESEDLLLAASLLAGAGDKFGDFTLDMVVYINKIYGISNIETVFDFSGFAYGGTEKIYGTQRGSSECAPGLIWVLQPTDVDTFTAMCVSITDITGTDENGELVVLEEGVVKFTPFEDNFALIADTNFLAKVHADYITEVGNFDYIENVRGFTKAASDALQVLEYVHNYSVPEDIYGN